MRISAAILSGGSATRFGGADKSGLMVEGRTILERQLAEISQVADDIIIVGEPTASAAVSRVNPVNLVNSVNPVLRAVPDTAPGLGPLGGLHTALQEFAGSALLVVACDMPYLSAPFLAHLAHLAPEADAVVPQTNRGYHPLCAVYTRACRQAVADRLADRRLAMMDLLTDLRLRVVMAEEIERFGDPDRLLANVNTPADLHDAFSGDKRHER